VTGRYPNAAVAVRRLLLTTAKTTQPQTKRVMRCWGRGESRSDEHRWPLLRMPSWISPEGEFRYSGVGVQVTRRRVIVVGWITKRLPLSVMLDDLRPSPEAGSVTKGYVDGRAA
jgi:hypothetical protein